MRDLGKSRMNWSQARERIDRGETGDKIAVEDPAAAPLGTDAEAGGFTTGEEHIAHATAVQQAGPAARARAQRRTIGPSRRALVGMALVAIAVACTIALIALALAR